MRILRVFNKASHSVSEISENGVFFCSECIVTLSDVARILANLAF